MSHYYNDSVFWIELDKIKPNPLQPRKDFDRGHLESLADSIRQYGVLQALVVTRKEITKRDGGLVVEYELIAGERRLRAAKIAGLSQVPVLIKTGEETDQMKLELAIIENLQREDLNPVDRARAFERLVSEFGFKHLDIAKRVGKSREYVTNTIRLLLLPPEIIEMLSAGKISEGHTRPLLMLVDRPEEQNTLFKEIMFRKLNVREAEGIARKIAFDRVRKKDFAADPELAELEEKIATSLGTRVAIERREKGGKLMIDFFSNDDLRMILNLISSNKQRSPSELLEKHMAEDARVFGGNSGGGNSGGGNGESVDSEITETGETNRAPMDDRSPEEKAKQDSEDIYSVTNFSI